MTDTTQAPARGRVRVEQGAKRVRAHLGGQPVVDTLHPSLVWEIPYYPAYYLPGPTCGPSWSRPAPSSTRPAGATPYVYDVRIGDRVADGARAGLPGVAHRRSCATSCGFEWDAMDEWLEEDEPVYVHPRSPYTRVDILASTRHVQVVRGRGRRWPTPPTRTSCSRPGCRPATTCRWPTCAPSCWSRRSARASCPYKGTAHVLVGAGRRTRATTTSCGSTAARCPRAHKVAGLACFYNEKVDLVIDGVPQERPRTPFS